MNRLFTETVPTKMVRRWTEWNAQVVVFVHNTRNVRHFAVAEADYGVLALVVREKASSDILDLFLILRARLGSITVLREKI
jgi:hypothetical protein